MPKKKILVYAHYYAPDVASTGQILQDITESMIGEYDITVICTVPSYTGTVSSKYKDKRFYNENINGVNILRISVPEFKKTNKISRVINLLAYFFGARKATRSLEHNDYVFAISQPPIMGGLLGVYGKRKLKAKLIYNIQDFNPEQIEATGYIKLKLLIRFARWLDNRTCSQSDLVVTVGRDLVETLKHRFVNKRVPPHIMINNWIDEKEIYPLNEKDPNVDLFKQENGLTNKFIIMYSGNIGLYYDLDGIIKVIEKLQGLKTPHGQDVVFAFVGEGSLLDKLKSYVTKNEIDNTIFIPYQDKSKLIYSLNAADVHWCVNAKGIKGVSCPSKFYGIAAVGKPVLGVLEKGSEVEMLISEIGCGLCSEPGDYKSIENNIKWFVANEDSKEFRMMGKKAYDCSIKFLTKEKAVEKYKNAIAGI